MVSSALETFSIAKELSCVGGGLVDLWEVDSEERLACSSYTRTRIFHHARREGCQSCKGRTKAGGMYSSAFVKRNPALGLVGLHKRGIVFCAGWLRVRFLCRLWMRRQSQGSFAISPSHESRALQLTYCPDSHVFLTYCQGSHI